MPDFANRFIQISHIHFVTSGIFTTDSLITHKNSIFPHGMSNKQQKIIQSITYQVFLLSKINPSMHKITIHQTQLPIWIILGIIPKSYRKL